MRITYDPSVDAAYIVIVDPIEPGSSRTQIQIPHSDELHADFILDFDAEGSLLGIEILSASKGLKPETLARATRPTQ
jgi:uncharacterized protein YuzE